MVLMMLLPVPVPPSKVLVLVQAVLMVQTMTVGPRGMMIRG